MPTVWGEAFVEIRPELTKFAGELKEGISGAVGKAESESSGAFNRLAGVGKAAFIGIAGAAVGFGAAAIDAALKGQESTAQLANAVKQAGGNWDELEPRISKVTESYAKFGYENDQAEAALARLVQITGNTTQSLDLLQVAANLAAARHIDLTAAANLVGRAAEGNITPLKRMGITVADTGSTAGNAAAAIAALNERFGGAAQAQADTYAGKLKAFKAEAQNLTEQVGNALLPVVAGLVGELSNAVGFFEGNRTAAIALGIAVGGPLVVALGAYAIEQGRSIAMGAIQIAQRLPQFFLSLGATLQGTTASEVVLNESMAVTNATMLAGAVATGALIGGLGLIVYSLEHAKQSAETWAASIAAGAGPDPQRQLGALEEQLSKTAKAADDVHVGFVHFTEGGKQNADRVDALKSKIADLKGEMVKTKATTEDLGYTMVEGGDQADQAASQMTQLAGSVHLTSERTDELVTKLGINLAKTALPDATAKVAALNNELALGSAQSVTLHDAFGKLSDATSTATEKASAFKSALDVLIGGNIDAEKAVINFQDKVDGLSQKLQGNKLSLDATTKAGRDNITAVEDAVVAIRNHVEALKNQGAGADALQGALAGDTNALREQLTQAGYTKAQVDQLIRSYGLVPASLNTVISADIGQAYAAASQLAQKFSDLYNTARQIGNVSGSVGGLRHAARGGYWDGTHPELAVVGDSREVMLPLDDPRRMAEVLAQAGLGGGSSRPVAAAPTGVQVSVSIVMPGLATSPEAQRLIRDVAQGEFAAAMTQVMEEAGAGVGTRTGG